MKFTPELIERIKSNDPALTILDLAYEIESPEQGAELAAALKSNTTLTHIDLGKNFLGDEVIIKIINSLKNNPKLISLNLITNLITDECCEAIASMIETNKTLRSLDLKNNAMKDEGASKIINALENNTTLTFIRFYGGKFNEELVQKVVNLMKVNKNILNNDIIHHIFPGNMSNCLLNNLDARREGFDENMIDIAKCALHNTINANKIAKALVDGKVPNDGTFYKSLEAGEAAVKSVLVSEFKMADLDAANLVKKTLEIKFTHQITGPKALIAKDLKRNSPDSVMATLPSELIQEIGKMVGPDITKTSVAQGGVLSSAKPVVTNPVSSSSTKFADLVRDKPNNNDRSR